MALMGCSRVENHVNHLFKTNLSEFESRWLVHDVCKTTTKIRYFISIYSKPSLFYAKAFHDIC